MEGFLSIDISKEFLDSRLSVGLTEEKELPRINRNASGFRKLLKQAKAAGITKLHVCMEATGSYWNEVALFFHASSGVTVYIVNPARIKAQRKTEQKRSKSDKIDAGVIMRFLKANLSLLNPWSPPSPAVSELQDLVRFRDMLVRQRASLKTRLKSKVATSFDRLAKKQIKELDDDIEKLETEIEEVIKNDQVLSKQAKSAGSVQGIGLVTTAVLLSECRSFKEITGPRQATAFAGLDVVEESSGTIKKPPHISRQGSALLRKTFVCVASSAIRRQGRIRDFYLRLRGKGMKKKPALVAAARKLLEIAVAVVVSGATFEADRHLKSSVGSKAVA